MYNNYVYGVEPYGFDDLTLSSIYRYIAKEGAMSEILSVMITSANVIRKGFIDTRTKKLYHYTYRAG